MSTFISDIAFTDTVKAFQKTQGSRSTYQRMAERRDWKDELDPSIIEFIARRDSFYLATANKEGQPYIQHRGGPKGFLKALNSKTLAFADFSGNRQYISAGNLQENDKAYLFLMDYPNQTRVKIWGKAKVVSDDPALLEQLTDKSYNARVERAIVFEVTAWDINCPQHITPRFTAEELEPHIRPLQDRIEELEAKLKAYENA